MCTHTHTQTRDRKGSPNKESKILSFTSNKKILHHFKLLRQLCSVVVVVIIIIIIIIIIIVIVITVIILLFCCFRCKFFVSPSSLLGSYSRYLSLQYWIARYFHVRLMLHAARITAACTCLCTFFLFSGWLCSWSGFQLCHLGSQDRNFVVFPLSRRSTKGSFYCAFRYAWPVRHGHRAYAVTLLQT